MWRVFIIHVWLRAFGDAFSKTWMFENTPLFFSARRMTFETATSYVNCNKVFPKTFQELIDMFNRERTTPCPDMPSAIMDLIEIGLLKSNQILEAVKKAV